jgi:VanZ family protein
MLILLSVFAFLLLGGSLYPWHYRQGPDLDQAVWHVLTNWHEAVARSNRRDILVNLVIYVPIGFTGYLWAGWRAKLARWSCPLLAGALLSLTVETLQHYFPPREPSVVDLICNTVSTALGLILAAVLKAVLESRHVGSPRHAQHSLHLSSAVLLLGLWAASLAWPVHMFSFDVAPQLHGLLRPGPWSPLATIAGSLPWLLASRLLMTISAGKVSRWWLWATMPCAYGVMLVSSGSAFNWSYFAGSLSAVLVVTILPEARVGGEWLAWLWLLWIVVDGLRPFTILAHPQPFAWVPFEDMMNANWVRAILVLLQKTWSYGAVFWLLSQSRMSRASSLALIVLTIGTVEVAQRWLPGRSAGLTDPAIGILAAALLWLVDRRFARTKRAPAPAASPTI